MAIPISAIQALLAAKANAGAAPQGAPMAPPQQFPSTDPTAVGATLNPLAQMQQADQQNLVAGQQEAASNAMNMLLQSLASGPNPAAAAAQGGPATPTAMPTAAPDQGAAHGY